MFTRSPRVFIVLLCFLLPAASVFADSQLLPSEHLNFDGSLVRASQASRDKVKLLEGVQKVDGGILVTKKSGLKIKKSKNGRLDLIGPGALNAKANIRCDCGEESGNCSLRIEEGEFGDKVSCRGDSCCNLMMQSTFKNSDSPDILGAIFSEQKLGCAGDISVGAF